MIVKTGAAVILLPSVCSFITTTDPVKGRLYVVPETITEPPGVRVVPGPRMNAVCPLKTVAVIAWPLTVRMDWGMTEGFDGSRIEV